MSDVVMVRAMSSTADGRSDCSCRCSHIPGAALRALFLCIVMLGAGVSLPLLEAQSQTSAREVRQEIRLSPGRSRNPVFHLPERLRERVQFWTDIKAKYSENQSVIHHRWYPQAVYTVLDFRDMRLILSDQQLERYRRRSFDTLVAELRPALEHLATGATPRNDVERRVERWLARVPGGAEKYREVLDKDLIRSQRGIREKQEQALVRSGRYLSIMERIFVAEYGLPVELTRLPFVESSFDYKAFSSAGAAGIWQFMPATGRTYMTVNKILDERRDPLKATHAAAQYLRSAHNRIQDWPLALTSYNHGVGGVVSKVRRLGTSDISEIIESPPERLFGFASTNFYPSFLAALEIYERHEEYFPGVRPEAPRTLASFRVPTAMSARYVSQTLGISIADLQELNYALMPPVWNGSSRIPAGATVYVPAAYGNKLALLRTPEVSERVTAASPPSAIYGGVVYTVRRGDTLGAIARRYNTTVAQLRKLNGLKTDTVQVGQQLVVRPKENAPDDAGTSAAASLNQGSTTPAVAPRNQGAAPRQEQGSAGVSYTVKAGDSLWSIARRYNTTVKAIEGRNPQVRRGLRPGMIIVIP